MQTHVLEREREKERERERREKKNPIYAIFKNTTHTKRCCLLIHNYRIMSETQTNALKAHGHILEAPSC